MSLPSDAFRLEAARPHEPLRTYHPRRSALGPEREEDLRTLFPVLGFSVHEDEAFDAAAMFGRTAPLVLEIGSGMGETTAAMAAADPSRDYIAVEAHLPGVASLLGLVNRAGLTNVRVGHGDALDLVRRSIPTDALDAIHVFFPDPWPKARHHKRRLVQPSHVALLRSRLAVGGVLHCATDWVDYADAMLEALSADPFLANTADAFVDRPAHRPVTKFEQRGLDLGHEVRDLVFRRVR
ncbi:tRNA (guanosine(46)-N7)-methyltransferase TrmB [Cellulomonas sp. McL0617]|uniref:tRNA (guanosine(46)-N7)-methyltransferase TrmB n=1 Tax=Cellulomonas sp. McL0617 TaxID=3415675 RepID=UPI003CE9464F